MRVPHPMFRCLGAPGARSRRVGVAGARFRCLGVAAVPLRRAGALAQSSTGPDRTGRHPQHPEAPWPDGSARRTLVPMTSSPPSLPSPAAPGPPGLLDASLLDLAAAQHGVLTTSQLRTAGLDAPTLVGLVKRRALHHPGRGLYIVEQLRCTDAAEHHRQLVAGAFLLYPDAVLVSTSALLAHGVTVWGAPLDRPSLRRPMHRAGGMSAFWVRTSPGPAVETEWGPASPVADALALHAVDHGIAAGVVSADAALRAGQVCVQELSTAVDQVAGWVHGSRAVAMRALADGRRESVGESRCGMALAMAGIAVTPQVKVLDAHGRFVARVDFLVDGTRVVVEFDGRVKYAAGDPDILWAEKRREDGLRALGYVVVRITWADLETPGAVIAKVSAAIRAAA